MLRRLGMWNRLAIVAAPLGSLIGSAWIVLSENSEMSAARQKGYERCLESAFSPKSDGSLSAVECWDIWFENNPAYYQGWEEWITLAGFLFALCGVAYLIIWATVATAKWVWRGRQVNQS